MRTHQLVAFNTAINSDNKIHDDEVAKKFGFTGGLVPGVDVYAYLCWGPVSEWGEEWLQRGTAEVRFGSPTYDGDTVTVEWDGATGSLRNSAGMVVSSGTFGLAGSAPAVDPNRYAVGVKPPRDARPAASPASLVSGQALGPWQHRFVAADAGRYLADVRESLDLYQRLGVAHPGWVLRAANYVLSDNVVLGPWMHVGSKVRNLGPVGDGAAVEARALVSAEYEKKGHRFVELDVLILADGAPVAQIDHTAIYQPRQVAAA